MGSNHSMIGGRLEYIPWRHLNDSGTSWIVGEREKLKSVALCANGGFLLPESILSVSLSTTDRSDSCASSVRSTCLVLSSFLFSTAALWSQVDKGTFHFISLSRREQQTFPTDELFWNPENLSQGRLSLSPSIVEHFTSSLLFFRKLTARSHGFKTFCGLHGVRFWIKFARCHVEKRNWFPANIWRYQLLHWPTGIASQYDGTSLTPTECWHSTISYRARANGRLSARRREL